MLFIGLIALFASSYCIFSESISKIKRKKEEYSAIMRLLLHVRSVLSSGGGRLCDILRGFDSKPLEDNGLLDVLRSDAMSNENDNKNFCQTSRGFFRDNLARVHLTVDDDDSKKLLSYFSDYGKSYIEEEKRKLSDIIDYFRAREKSYSEKSEKDIKAAWTVFVFSFVGVFILLI